jgi:hypothetical protein
VVAGIAPIVATLAQLAATMVIIGYLKAANPTIEGKIYLTNTID